MEVGATTDVGLQRARNEDALLVDEDARVFAVADGLGGHPAGHLASRIAVDTLRRALHRSSLDRDEGPDQVLSAALREAHEAVLEGAAEDPSRTGMGTTVVLTMLADGDHEAW
ncbi:MAG TPA: protein phosphatase 2C domain-containing protein, partial [Nitriliruptorales bacterium]|nr:protein phosphatase 2C domain-containing protein [Nitriliruptorales bacterium]